MSKLTLKWTGNFPLALIGPNIFGNQQNILMAYLHNIYSGILYKVISIFGHDLNVQWNPVMRPPSGHGNLVVLTG